MSNDSNFNNTDEMKDQTLLDIYKQENLQLRKELARYEKMMEEYDLEGLDHMSDVEYICVEEIKKLRALSDAKGLDEVEVKNLDILHKNLRQVRSKDKDKVKKKEKEMSTSELLSIVQDDSAKKESQGSTK